MERKHINIAIDGPGGSGKSTLAKNIARLYGFIYIDTGALYRTVGFFVHSRGIEPSDRDGVIACLADADIRMTLENGGGAVYLNGKRMGDEIRTPVISKYASDVSRIPEVRAFLLELQRITAAENDCVMDGRDIGTVILPNADVKLFLSASEEERALRRYNELIEAGGNVTLEEIRTSMKSRDDNDRNRELSPAIPASDAVMLDNSGFAPEQTLEYACAVIKEKTGLSRDTRETASGCGGR